MPADQVAGLAGALNHLGTEAAGARAQALAALARDLGAAPGEPVRLTAPGNLLRELLLVAVDEAGEALSGLCTALLRGDGSAAAVRAGVADLSGLLDLLDTVER
ncbi:MAG: hypothetical protein QOH58_3600 [Thermoleophilaceae bacterium]|nr:hypothetical protein [Thermoleophilaceae bacterium]